jgi:peptidylprolyl isomerase
VIGGAVALFANSDDGGDSNVSTDSPSTTAPAGSTGSTGTLASAAGKPCVAVTDALPAGAPEVPVQVGTPPTSLVSKDLQPGTGAEATASSTVTVDYIGVSCSTGKVFDTSYGKTPATFPLGNVIPGWQQGIPGMKVGGTRLLGIPPSLAYGAQGYPPDIAPDETLWFVVQLKNVS